MISQLRLTLAVFSMLFACAAFAGPEEDVDALLSRMHEASKNADVAYFDLFADDAVFFGTDLWERWTKDKFEALYRPYMESGKGWEFKMRDRRIDIQPCGTIALFDETLFSESFGPCRGSGAARLDDGAWEVVRYHLDITIPNDVVDEVVPLISAFEASRVELMSFNIRFGTADDGENSWPNRHEDVAALIRAELPDVLGLQEALRFQIDELIERCPGYDWVGVGRDDGESAGEHAPIFYRTDRVRLIKHGTFWFSNTPSKPGTTSFGNTIPRICTWAIFEPTGDSETQRFGVANVHLDHQSAESRLLSVQMLLHHVAEWIGTQPFLMGDFNTGPSSQPIRDITQHGWKNTAKTPGPTFNGFRDEASGEMIDFIFAPDRLVVDEWEIIDDSTDDGRWPSDHLPVRAIVRLTPQR